MSRVENKLSLWKEGLDNWNGRDTQLAHFDNNSLNVICLQVHFDHALRQFCRGGVGKVETLTDYERPGL